MTHRILKSAALSGLLALSLPAAGTVPVAGTAGAAAIPPPVFTGPMPKPLPLSQLTDVNHAPKAELMKLPGVTSALADKIIAKRPYLSKAKLVTQGVVTLPVFQGFRNQIYTGATAAAKP